MLVGQPGTLVDPRNESFRDMDFGRCLVLTQSHLKGSGHLISVVIVIFFFVVVSMRVK